MCKENSECRHYVCECGKSFEKGCQLGGHQLGCPIHKAKLEEQRLEHEKRRLPNGLFKCENPDCNNEHDGSYGSGLFCSKKCRMHVIGKRSYETKMKNGNFRSGILESDNPRIKRAKGNWKCSTCGLLFHTRSEMQTHYRNEHYNGKKCNVWNKGLTKETDKRMREVSEKQIGKSNNVVWTDEMKKHMSEIAKRRHFGGVPTHGGKGKRGWYKGYWCDSSWELSYVIYNLEHGIHFVRNRQGFDYEYQDMKKKYFPDFLLDDGTYVEVKGYEDEKVRVKHTTFISTGHVLNVIGKEEIKPYLKYAIEKYGKKFTDLYE